MAKLVRVALAELIEDSGIYIRHSVDSSNVARLERSARAGMPIPPIVIEKKSKRIVDGWHRSRMWRRVLGDDGVIEVEAREYDSEQDLFLDVTKLNSSHGRQLDRIDQQRAALMARALGATDGQIALALHVEVAEVKKLQVKFVVVPPSSGSLPGSIPGDTPGTYVQPLKLAVRHFQGQQFTDEQALAHKSLLGVPFLNQVNSLLGAVREGLIPADNEPLREALTALRDALDAYLAVPAA